MKSILTTVLTLTSLLAVGQNFEISSKNGESKELEGKSQIERIIKNYDKEIRNWIFIKKIIIDKNAIPFSHPILTLNCNYLDNDLKQLSNFLHEQFHWFVESKGAEEENVAHRVDTLHMDIQQGSRQ